MPLMPSPFSKRRGSGEDYAVQLCPGGAGTPYLWELSRVPDSSESRLRRDTILLT